MGIHKSKSIVLYEAEFMELERGEVMTHLEVSVNRDFIHVEFNFGEDNPVLLTTYFHNGKEAVTLNYLEE